MDLKSRLMECAAAWAAAWSAAEGREFEIKTLSKRVMDDGKFLDGLTERRYGPTTDTLERFARYFLEPATWPAEIPEVVRVFAHVVGVSAAEAGPSSDNAAFGIGAGSPVPGAGGGQQSLEAAE